MISFFFFFLIIVEKEERVGRKGVPRSNDSYDVRVISQSGLRFLGGWLVQTLPEILQRGQSFGRTDGAENLG